MKNYDVKYISIFILKWINSETEPIKPLYVDIGPRDTHMKHVFRIALNSSYMYYVYIDYLFSIRTTSTSRIPRRTG